MKSIADFICGKVRRAELGGSLEVDTTLPDHPSLGPGQARVSSEREAFAFYERGLVTGDDKAIAYDDIDVVIMSPTEGETRIVDVRTTGGDTVRLRASVAGAKVVHATLRWIGHVILRRKIAD